MSLDLAELLRRFENLFRIGTIAEIDASAALVRVKYDLDESGADVLTNWIKWGVSRAGDDVVWNPPQIDEQVLFASISGDPSIAAVICSLYQTAFPAPDSSLEKRLLSFSDGAEISYDKSAKKLAIILPEGGSLEVTGNLDVTGDVTITGNITQTGDMDITGMLTINGVNIGLHTHTTTSPGSPTGPPQ